MKGKSRGTCPIHQVSFQEAGDAGVGDKAVFELDEAVAFVRRCREVHGLPIDGLMAIPPEGLPPGAYFAHLAMLARDAQTPTLSMGMSADFETAIAMGATHVRVGSALFGYRA